MMLILLAVLATAVSAAVEEVIWSIDLPSISYDPIDAWVQQGIEIQWTSTTSGMTGWNELTTTYTLGSPSPSFWFEWSGTGARVNATTRAASSFTNATTIGKLEVDGESLPIVVTGTAGSETWFAVDGLSMDTKHRAVVTLDPPWSAMFAIESVEVLIPVHTKGMFFNDTSMPVNDFTMGNARLDTAHFNFTGDWQAELQINSSFVADSIDKSESYMYIAKGEPGSKVTYALASNSTLMTVQAAFGPEYGDLDIRIEPHPIGGSNLSTVSTNRPKNFQLATVLTAVLDSEVEYIMSVGPSANSTLPVGLVATSVFNYFAVHYPPKAAWLEGESTITPTGTNTNASQTASASNTPSSNASSIAQQATKSSNTGAIVGGVVGGVVGPLLLALLLFCLLRRKRNAEKQQLNKTFSVENLDEEATSDANVTVSPFVAPATPAIPATQHLKESQSESPTDSPLQPPSFAVPQKALEPEAWEPMPETPESVLPIAATPTPEPSPPAPTLPAFPSRRVQQEEDVGRLEEIEYVPPRYDPAWDDRAERASPDQLG